MAAAYRTYEGIALDSAAQPDPAAYLRPRAPITMETEAAWFTSVYGMYLRSMAGVEEQLVRASAPGKYVYIAERVGQGLEGKMDHLVCFAPGMLALGSLAAPSPQLAAHHLDLARDLMRTCYRMYESAATGLAPEISRFNNGADGVPDPGAKHNLLRPETAESLFVLYRVTGDNVYRKWGWAIFQAFKKWARVPSGGYSSLADVTVTPPQLRDNQESFWLAETLKYLYLLFSDSATIPLDEYVFNTEAHPLRVFEPVMVTTRAG
jgi:mannosyl-oligosaccharide alpha-1,2-mannosidase